MTTLGFFWMALWAFCLGYVISSMIQVFITRQRMQRTMGEAGPRSVLLGTFFGFISSSCSFAALSTSRALFQKGAGLVPSLAFLLASTNLVIELGILIFIFLSWHFVVGEYVGGVLLILLMWAIVRLTLPKSLVDQAREHAQRVAGNADEDDETVPDWKQRIKSRSGWRMVSQRYWMEWSMVWKDVTFGFTIAGVIAAFVPPEAFQTLFIGSGSEGPQVWWHTLLQTIIGPVAAFFTFIGSMGNIPLAGLLFASGVSFAGIMAFIFSDLVVFPVLRISARYFGWKMAAYILGVFLASLVATSLILHYAMSALNLLPDRDAVPVGRLDPSSRFAVDYTLFLNVAFVIVSVGLFWFSRTRQPQHDGGEHEHHHTDEQQHEHKGHHDSDHEGEARHAGHTDHDGDNHTDNGHQGHHHHHGGGSWMQRILGVLAIASIVWLVGGVMLWLFGIN